MYWLVAKYMLTAGLVVLISEIAKRSDKFGALVAALPVVTMFALIWMYIEGQPVEKLSNHAFYTFWYVLPSLPMFLVFPFLYPMFSFWLTLLICSVLTVVAFVMVAVVCRYFGIELY